MVRIVLVSAAASMLAVVSPASAQTGAAGSGSRASAPFRVQAQMQVSLPAPNLDDVDSQKLHQEVARKALYDMMNRECRALRETFGGDCRLTMLNVSTQVQNRRSSGSDTVVASGSATFEIAEAGARP